ncbi:hypothetical protein KM043_007295 [Ampulex compressa]|nr:hypothetical protein KM043_007295 [Ampulex compressa]
MGRWQLQKECADKISSINPAKIFRCARLRSVYLEIPRGSSKIVIDRNNLRDNVDDACGSLSRAPRPHVLWLAEGRESSGGRDAPFPPKPRSLSELQASALVDGAEGADRVDGSAFKRPPLDNLNSHESLRSPCADLTARWRGSSGGSEMPLAKVLEEMHLLLPKMRAALFALACLCMAGCAFASDGIMLGEREEGDMLITNRFIYKPPIFGIPMVVRLGAHAPKEWVISCVSVKSLGGGKVSATVIMGGINTRTLLVLVRGEPGEGLSVEFTVYAKPLPMPTTTTTTTTTTTMATTTTHKPLPTSEHPTNAPTHKPTMAPTHKPTMAPTHKPTEAPTHKPTMAPTHKPTMAPTHKPTVAPTHKPTVAPTHKPTMAPTHKPTMAPTHKPTMAPTHKPTEAPTHKPTVKTTIVVKPTTHPTTQHVQ